MRVLLANLTYHVLSRRHHPHHILPPLDLGWCASVLRADGAECVLADTLLEHVTCEDVLAAAERTAPDLVVARCELAAADGALALLRGVRERAGGCPVVALDTSIPPEALLAPGSPVDAAVRGEAELTVREAARRVREGRPLAGTPGLAVRRGGSVSEGPPRPWLDPDALPFPAHDLFLDSGYNLHYPVPPRAVRFASMVSSRGCPFPCLFCSPATRSSHGKDHRARSPRNVVDEMAFLAGEGVNTIYFQDDIFTLDRGRVMAICRELGGRGLDLSWAVQSRVNTFDEGLARAMARAGCTTVSFGVESGSPRVLDGLCKGARVEDVRSAFAAARAAGMFTVAYLMLGSPGETLEDVERTRSLLHELEPDLVQLSFFTPYPGSPAWASAAERPELGRLSHHNSAACCPSPVPAGELERLRRGLYLGYYLRPAFLVRYLRDRLPFALRNVGSEAHLVRGALGLLRPDG